MGRNSEAGLFELQAVAREEKADGRHMPHGQLNPPWVEWLMGWPIGWTDLKPRQWTSSTSGSGIRHSFKEKK